MNISSVITIVLVIIVILGAIAAYQKWKSERPPVATTPAPLPGAPATAPTPAAPAKPQKALGKQVVGFAAALIVLVVVGFGAYELYRYLKRPPTAPAAKAQVDYTVTIKNVTEKWSSSEAHADPEEARGAKLTWTLLDTKGSTDCYTVRISQGEFEMCPGQKFKDVPDVSSFARFKMNGKQESPREIVLRVKS